ncbi:MAG: rod shape-determining protein [Candidatus Kapaibacteriales bacterium]
MLRAFIRKVANNWQPAQRIIVSVPSGITPVEKRAVRDSCEQAGAKEVHLISEPMSAAIGIGLDVHNPVGNMIVDIGGGTTEIAVIALGGIVADESVKTAGDHMTNAVAMWFRRQHNILIGDRTAEMIKCAVGSAMPLEEELEIEVKGRDLLGGVPRMINVSSADIRSALSESVQTIVDSILKLLERTPPELSADIYDRGIMLTGGGALLKGLDRKIMEVTNLPVHIPDDPLEAVARGNGKVLDEFNEYKKVLLKTTRF